MAMTENVLETMYNKLDKFLKTETVIGEPMDLGEIKLIPIVTASFGLGGGLGEENKDSGKSEGGGGGLGCRISPDAILVIKGDKVELIKLQGKRSLDKLFEMMPELIEKVESLKSSKGHDSESEDKEEDE
ncbi:MAG: GerW family sporulation protein [Bacillota bacterium]